MYFIACYISRAERKNTELVKSIAKRRKIEIESKIDSRIDKIQKRIYKRFKVPSILDSQQKTDEKTGGKTEAFTGPNVTLESNGNQKKPISMLKIL